MTTPTTIVQVHANILGNSLFKIALNQSENRNKKIFDFS
jgi:hypothetical protein